MGKQPHAQEASSQEGSSLPVLKAVHEFVMSQCSIDIALHH
jgi:hypothetical protein